MKEIGRWVGQVGQVGVRMDVEHIAGKLINFQASKQHENWHYEYIAEATMAAAIADNNKTNSKRKVNYCICQPCKWHGPDALRQTEAVEHSLLVLFIVVVVVVGVVVDIAHNAHC